MNEFSNLTARDINLSWAPVIAPHFRLQFEPAQDTHVLLYPEGMIKLNPSGSEILSRCNGITIEQIILELKTKFPEAVGIENDILEFLAIAYQKQWLIHGGS